MSGNQDNHVLKLGVVSGKGGVGKSTITAALINLMHADGKKIVGVDCDVDAPNLALLFTVDKNEMDTKTVRTTEKAYWIEERCTHCKECIDEKFCLFNALKWNAEKKIPVLDVIACEGCGACSVLCNHDAFGIRPIDSGTMYSTVTGDDFPLIYGETIIGASTSGKMVSETKEFALHYLEGADHVVIDGPPGIGCPVLATLTGLDFVIVVMEPFPTSFHDASRVIEVINGFNIPFGIVINRCDAWDDGYKDIKKFIKENNYTYLGDIPIDMKVPESVTRMLSIIKHAPDSPASIALKKIHENLEKVLNRA
ncbi:MAG: P-loop NTPase [Candidatus Hodarchaeota archaeon]